MQSCSKGARGLSV